MESWPAHATPRSACTQSPVRREGFTQRQSRPPLWETPGRAANPHLLRRVFHKGSPYLPFNLKKISFLCPDRTSTPLPPPQDPNYLPNAQQFLSRGQNLPEPPPTGIACPAPAAPYENVPGTPQPAVRPSLAAEPPTLVGNTRPNRDPAPTPGSFHKGYPYPPFLNSRISALLTQHVAYRPWERGELEAFAGAPEAFAQNVRPKIAISARFVRDYYI